MRKFAFALLALATALPAFAAGPPAPSRRETLDKLVTLSHAEDLEKTALAAALITLENLATTPEQKEALQQLRERAAARSTHDLWVTAFERNLDDKTLAGMLAMYESAAAEQASQVVRITLPSAMQERLKPVETDKTLLAARRTMADIRMLATALEARATDTNEYPESCDMETLRKLVEPTYIRHMPSRDAWGHAYLYIGSPSRTEYRIVSAGSDGIFEANSRILSDTSRGPTERYEDDLIYQNGEFIQAPRVLVEKNP
ncbi:MAG TPA: type II secretion system protein GspG [Thermoanaerobaculia bacterium]|nr:type II secretion system protein GspG [Thermoanaerobaculia bacterium]